MTAKAHETHETPRERAGPTVPGPAAAHPARVGAGRLRLALRADQRDHREAAAVLVVAGVPHHVVAAMRRRDGRDVSHLDRRRRVGSNIPVAWAFDITNFVFWIGIGHAGTLISRDPVPVPAEVADEHQSLHRSDDDLRRDLCRSSIPASTSAGSGTRGSCFRCRTRTTSSRTSARALLWDLFAISARTSRSR